MDCVIFDLDGTLTDVSHRLHLIRGGCRDWAGFFDACKDDPPHDYVVGLARSLFYEGLDRDQEIIICSGRPDSHREATKAWLREHGVRYTKLMMRQAGDHRPDVVVKKEMLDQLRARGYHIRFAVDDRPSVVRMWRENGVPCFACPDDNWRTPMEIAFGLAEFPHAGKTLLTIMVGPSGAGKSSWLACADRSAGSTTRIDRLWIYDRAIEPPHSFGIHASHVISSDQLRQDLLGDWRDQSANHRVFAVMHSLARVRLAAGLPTVLDATHLRRKDRLAAAALAPGGSRVRYVVMNRPLSEKLADGRVPVGVIEKHEQIFQSNLKDILAGDGQPNVDVVDLRAC